MGQKWYALLGSKDTDDGPIKISPANQRFSLHLTRQTPLRLKMWLDRNGCEIENLSHYEIQGGTFCDFLAFWLSEKNLSLLLEAQLPDPRNAKNRPSWRTLYQHAALRTTNARPAGTSGHNIAIRIRYTVGRVADIVRQIKKMLP